MQKPRFLIQRYNAKFLFFRPLNDAAWQLLEKRWFKYGNTPFNSYLEDPYFDLPDLGITDPERGADQYPGE
jgi:hypothetical protein